MKKLLTALLIVAAHTAFAQGYTVKTQLTGFPDGTKFYLQDLDAQYIIDSAALKSGELQLKGKLDAPVKGLWLYARHDNKFYYCNLLMGNEAVTVKGDMKDFPFDVSITGSKIQDANNRLVALTSAGNKKRNELIDQYFALKGDSAEIKGKQIWKVIGKIDSVNDVATAGFIKREPNTFAALRALFYARGKYAKDSLQHIYNTLQPDIKKSAFAQRIASYLKIGDVLKKGDMATDFEAMDEKGAKHKLSDAKGKYVLLDFSTTYCGPCMASITDLKEINTKYADKVAIMTVSGDGGRDMWMQSIKRDKPEWLSVWDGKGIYGETLLKYGVSGFPTFVVVDPQGKIVSHFSGYGKNADGKGSLITAVDKVLAPAK
ncbi:thioredoxin-like domain-containing protein [Mucilaginibacter myungsuensis]|uniref:DUF4369 domain-containing protein n=1 Tax=Mucilaginibacter myungsuensis TaxID=649104 RepID=A0A929L226_9SPHI|nr:thioredoxin-like domain-containing protein [Mucilaginibacter myungsuensis]MBE9661816.1 DUF4369 domain-containing protein [Mucilaginibacter myungsuensis]MDN3599750.1 thioredoxin-like domain-containing protein [Mucilaginibacter myungsuensis]